MADNFTANPGTGGDTFAADDVAGVKYPYSKLDIGGDGISSPVTAANPMPVTGPVTDAQLRATPLPITSASAYAEDTLHVTGAIGNLMLAIRSDTDTSTADDGDYTILKMDEAGRLKVAVQPAGYPLVTGTITSASSAVPSKVSRVSNVMVYVVGTFAGVNFTFEGSLNSTNGTNGNWFGIQAVRTNANTIETTSGVLGAPPAYGWELSVNGLNWFRVRATAWTSGTATIQIQPGAYATEPIPAAQISGTQPVSGTVTANIGTGSIAAGTNAIGDFGIQYRSTATGAASAAPVTSPATPAGQSIKGSAGRLAGYDLHNAAVTRRYVKFFNATSVTMGTTSALFEVCLEPSQARTVNFPGGLGFSTGIQIAVTSARGLTDNTATGLAAGDVTGFIASA
ncbi:MAG: hypothetical protein IM336_02400 [Microcystis sp. M018S1]|uniref:hypothetical protein n=1 Tax=Microcystis sp. M018S1 TaxID=2771108 RepID=UPI0025886443|nr:hypothetical protein [Microcystis sp. M018S1]MCA2929405.1 hypothetical protein [Microcystis sp. M018S1]